MGTKTSVALALLVVMAGTATSAGAADWSVVPSVAQRSEYISNLNMDFTNVKHDYMFTLWPAVDFNYTTEVSQLTGHLGIIPRAYALNGNLDTIDQNYGISGSYRPTPRINLSLTTGYIVDSSLQEELAASGVVMTRTPRKAIFVSPAVSYNLTERLIGTLNYSFNQVTYQDPQFQNYYQQTVGAVLNYLLKNERTTLTGNVVLGDTEYTSGTTSGNYQRYLGLYAGGQHQFTEKFGVNVLAGVNLNHYSFNSQVLGVSFAPYYVLVPTPTRVIQDQMAPYVTASLAYRGINWNLGAGFSTSQNADAYGGISNYQSFFGAVSYNFTERLTGTLGGSYSFSSQASNPSNGNNSSYYSLGPQLTYQLTEKLSVSPGYQYAVRNQYNPTQSANAHNVWVMLNYIYPIHYQR